MAISTLTTSWILLASSLALPFLMSATEEEDTALIQAVLDGDPSAYRGLVERYQKRVYNVVFGMVRDKEDAQELAQEAFIKAYRNLAGFRRDSRFYTWLCRIAINLSIDFLRKRKNRSSISFEENIGVRNESGDFISDHSLGDPHQSTVNREIRNRIIEEVEKLPEDQKQAIVLREIDGLSYKEIAEIMGIPEGTVMSRLYYARRKLQQGLKDLL